MKSKIIKAVISIVTGLAISGLSYFVEIGNRFGWPIHFYIDDPAGCDNLKCWTALNQFYPEKLLVNSLIWAVVVFVSLVVISKLRKNGKNSKN